MCLHCRLILNIIINFITRIYLSEIAVEIDLYRKQNKGQGRFEKATPVTIIPFRCYRFERATEWCELGISIGLRNFDDLVQKKSLWVGFTPSSTKGCFIHPITITRRNEMRNFLKNLDHHFLKKPSRRNFTNS